MRPAKTLNVLFLLKKNSEYTHYHTSKSGLLNSAKHLIDILNEPEFMYMVHNSNILCSLEIVVDGNDIEREIVKHSADVVILEAIWCPPSKVAELHRLYPKVIFIVRVHSKIAFLANEGIAIQWLYEYDRIPNVGIAFNSFITTEDFKTIGLPCIYLPNLYLNAIKHNPHKEKHIENGEVHIGCFGAIRPLKNQLIQAMAAIKWAESHDLKLRFHINGSRLENMGENVKKNIVALFDNVNGRHKLIQHTWLSYKDFLEIVATMNLGMQVSMSETFNIVTADFVSLHIPIVVSDEIEWMPDICKADMTSIASIEAKLNSVFFSRPFTRITKMAQNKLIRHNKISKEHWVTFFEKILKHPQHDNG